MWCVTGKIYDFVNQRNGIPTVCVSNLWRISPSIFPSNLANFSLFFVAFGIPTNGLRLELEIGETDKNYLVKGWNWLNLPAYSCGNGWKQKVLSQATEFWCRGWPTFRKISTSFCFLLVFLVFGTLDQYFYTGWRRSGATIDLSGILIIC